MLERFSITVAAATILGVIGKIASLYHVDIEAGNDWFVGPVDQTVITYILLAVFLVFFRGKMMHDDATFFADLEKPDTFKSGNGWKYIIKVGLLLGYLSWLLWAPAIYFLDYPVRFSSFLIASLVLSTFCLVIDILTRKALEWRRAFWIIPNVLYIVCLVSLTQSGWASLSAAALLAVLIIDWLVTDPLSGHV